MKNQTKGKIALTGFKLEPAEKVIVENIIRNYKVKLDRFGYKEIRLRMKKSIRRTRFLHEVQGVLIAERTFTSKVRDYNLFLALSEVFEKLLHEAQHFKRTIKQKAGRRNEK